MDQRVYYGNINPQALADYLVGAFQQPAYYQPQQPARAQKIMQGERIYVQIMRNSDWGLSGRGAVGVHIVSIPGGVSVEMGASDWLNVDETGLALGLLGALFFPPLLLFPLLQGLTGSSFSYDVWDVVDTYCVQVSTDQRQQTQPGFYCTYCGAFNHPGAPRCHSCHAPFKVAPQPQPAAQSVEPQPEPTAGIPTSPQSVEPQPEPEPEAGESHKKGDTRPMFALMICPNCKATVVPAHFCGNCAAPLPDVSEEKA